jgi:hypothetical protein
VASGCAGSRTTSAKHADSYNPSQVEIAPAPGAQPVSNELAAPDPSAPANWQVLEVLTYDQRLQFYGGFPFVLAAVDKQIADLNAKRSRLRRILGNLIPNPVIKELRAARENFAKAGSKMNAADVHDWDASMDLAGLAWQRTQDAVVKVSASALN